MKRRFDVPPTLQLTRWKSRFKSPLFRTARVDTVYGEWVGIARPSDAAVRGVRAKTT